MNHNRKFFAVCLVLFLAARLLAADTNAVSSAPVIAAPEPLPGATREEIAENYLHIQEQIHEAQLAIEQNQKAALDASQSNAILLTARLNSLEQSVAQQHALD